MTRVGVENKAQELATVKDSQSLKGIHNATDINIMDGRSSEGPGVDSATGPFTNAYTIEEEAKEQIPQQTMAFKAGRESNKRLKSVCVEIGSMQNEEQVPVCRLIQCKNAVRGRKCNHAD